MALYTTDTGVIAGAKKISGDHLEFISAPRDFDGIGKCLRCLCVLLISDPDAADGFVCRLTFRQSLTLDSIQSTIRADTAKKWSYGEEMEMRPDEQSNLHIYIYSNSLSLLPHHSVECLLLGTADWMCVMSTEFNGELLKVFSKSFVFTKLLFVDHGNAEQLLPPAGPLLAARWNWSIVLSFKQLQDKYHHYAGLGKL